MPPRLIQLSKTRRFLEAWRAFKSNRLALIGLGASLALFAIAFLGSLAIPFDDAIRQNISERFTPPCLEHPLGTDGLGRDMLARMLHGAKVSLTMGFIPMAASMLAGMFFGGLAVLLGGWVESLIMRVCDIMTCIPAILLALAMVAALGPGLGNVLLAITIASVPELTRYVRSVILGIAGLEYIEAARACGASGGAIIARHILPNAMGPLLLGAVSNISGMIMAGAGLSYLGLGIQLPNPEWGAMLAESQSYFHRAPYLMVAPGIAILVSVFAFNLAGDGLRDALDAKLR
jgi:peptide/nickel transport system permease protein